MLTIRRFQTGDENALSALIRRTLREVNYTSPKSELDYLIPHYSPETMVELSRTGHTYVLEEDGQPVGYAYAHPLGQRAAYQWSGELSIYLSPAAAGKGGGRPLYLALMELLRLQGMRTVYGVVTHPNPASEAFHAAMGFRLLGTQHNSGYKNGRWLDVALYEKPLSDYPDAPPVPVPLDQLPRETVEEVLAKYTQMLNETNRGRLP